MYYWEDRQVKTEAKVAERAAKDWQDKYFLEFLYIFLFDHEFRNLTIFHPEIN